MAMKKDFFTDIALPAISLLAFGGVLAAMSAMVVDGMADAKQRREMTRLSFERSCPPPIPQVQP